MCKREARALRLPYENSEIRSRFSFHSILTFSSHLSHLLPREEPKHVAGVADAALRGRRRDRRRCGG